MIVSTPDNGDAFQTLKVFYNDVEYDSIADVKAAYDDGVIKTKTKSPQDHPWVDVNGFSPSRL